MAEDQLLGMRKRAQHLRRALVGHGIKAASERLAINRDAVLGMVRLRGKCCAVRFASPLPPLRARA
jgi:hypothetical protein